MLTSVVLILTTLKTDRLLDRKAKEWWRCGISPWMRSMTGIHVAKRGIAFWAYGRVRISKRLMIFWYASGGGKANRSIVQELICYGIFIHCGCPGPVGGGAGLNITATALAWIECQ